MLLLFSIIGLVIVLITIAGVGLSGGGAPMAGVVMLVAGSVLGGITVLYYLTARATMRAHRWAPLTMMILFLLAVAAHGISLATMAATSKPEEAVGSVVVIIFAGLFAIVSWNAFAAIPKGRAQPAWCQELIVKAGL